MGASPTLDEQTGPVPAAVMSTQAPDVRVEEADDGGESRVFVEGTMYHAGLNKNAWGLTKTGAEAIASDLVDRDYTAAHPEVRGTKYDRSIAEGQGAPIGTVHSTDVVSVDSAIDGGQYTASYIAEVKDPVFKQKMEAGLFDSDGYGVSIGIYADPETASCSVCSQAMNGENCDHRRGEEVTVESDDGEDETRVAGPLYDAGDADHLAHVWRPAYEGATAKVASAAPDGDGGIAAYSADSAQQVLSASEVLGSPHDAGTTSEPAQETDSPDESSVECATDEQRAYRVRLSSAAQTARRQRSRGSYHVQLQ